MYKYFKNISLTILRKLILSSIYIIKKLILPKNYKFINLNPTGREVPSPKYRNLIIKTPS